MSDVGQEGAPAGVDKLKPLAHAVEGPRQPSELARPALGDTGGVVALLDLAGRFDQRPDRYCRPAGDPAECQAPEEAEHQDRDCDAAQHARRGSHADRSDQCPDPGGDQPSRGEEKQPEHAAEPPHHLGRRAAGRTPPALAGARSTARSVRPVPAVASHWLSLGSSAKR